MKLSYYIKLTLVILALSPLQIYAGCPCDGDVSEEEQQQMEQEAQAAD